MKSAVIYARYSCSSQTEQSIEGQLDVCNKFADSNDLQIVKVYADRAMTGTNDNRPDFQQMLKDSERANWDVVLVYALDRFGRNAIEVAINKQKLKKNGKILISATQRTSENLDGTKNLDGIILENVYIGIAEYYSAELSQKVRRGQNESRKKGQYCGGSVPYGYKLVNKKLQIDEDKANIIRYIFDQYSIGMSVREIIEHLHSLGMTRNGEPFKPTTVCKMLANTRYSGKYILHGIEYDNIYPRIVKQSVIDQVHKRLALNKVGKGDGAVPFLLKHKVYCGYCGCNISGESGTSKKGHTNYYYKCNGKKKHNNGCQKQQIRKDVLEHLVISSVVNAIKNNNIFTAMVNHILELQNSKFTENEKLKNLMDGKTRIEVAIQNMLTAIENGIVSKSANKRLEELEQKVDDFERQIAEEKGKEIVPLSREEIEHYYLDCMQKNPRLIIETIVDKVVLYDEYAEIYFKTPLTKSPDESQGFLIYSKSTKINELHKGKGPRTQITFYVNLRI